MRWLATILFVSIAALAAPATAEEQAQAPAAAEATTEDLARQYISIGGAEDSFVGAAAYGFRAAAEAQGLRLTDTQWQRLQAAVRDAFRPAAEVYTHDLTAFYAAHGSREDLVDALAFYRTPAGNHYVAASLAAMLPVIIHLSSQGRVALEDAPSSASLDPDRLALSGQLAEVMMARLHSSERTALEMTPIGVDGMEDRLARSLASTLDASELTASLNWARSPASQRLEGPSAERTLAMQTAMMRARHAVDLTPITQAIEDIRRENEA